MRLWIHSTENSGFSRVVRNGNIYKIKEKMKQYVNVSVQEKLVCLSLKWIIVSLNHCGIYIPMDIFKRMTNCFIFKSLHYDDTGNHNLSEFVYT